jgi:hypothetical protein
MDAKTLADRINASDNVASRKATLKNIGDELCKLIDKDTSLSKPSDVLEDSNMSAKEKAIAALSYSDTIKLALPKMCTHVMSGKMTVDDFATLVADTYNNLQRMCVMHGVAI